MDWYPVLMTSGCIHPDGSEHDWSVLVRRRQTLVFYMPLRVLDLICKQLVTHGLPSDWPAMLIFEGTAPAQRVLRGTLMSLPRLATADGMVSPAVLVVGEVTALADRLDDDGTPSPITGDAGERRDTVYALL